MGEIEPGSGIEILYAVEALGLLADTEVGRVSFVDDPFVLTLPVNYALDDHAIVFRTGPGAKLRAACGQAACFEIDGFDPATKAGWSVIVQGHLDEVTDADPELLDRVGDLAHPWLGGDRSHVIRLTPSRISGRRVPGTAGA